MAPPRCAPSPSPRAPTAGRRGKAPGRLAESQTRCKNGRAGLGQRSRFEGMAQRAQRGRAATQKTSEWESRRRGGREIADSLHWPGKRHFLSGTNAGRCVGEDKLPLPRRLIEAKGNLKLDSSVKSPPPTPSRKGRGDTEAAFYERIRLGFPASGSNWASQIRHGLAIWFLLTACRSASC
jgi:hypothetical protein